MKPVPHILRPKYLACNDGKYTVRACHARPYETRPPTIATSGILVHLHHQQSRHGNLLLHGQRVDFREHGLDEPAGTLVGNSIGEADHAPQQRALVGAETLGEIAHRDFILGGDVTGIGLALNSTSTALVVRSKNERMSSIGNDSSARRIFGASFFAALTVRNAPTIATTNRAICARFTFNVPRDGPNWRLHQSMCRPRPAPVTREIRCPCACLRIRSTPAGLFSYVRQWRERSVQP